MDKDATHKELVLGHEEWPFPVPLANSAKGWMFDTAAGKQEVRTAASARMNWPLSESVRRTSLRRSGTQRRATMESPPAFMRDASRASQVSRTVFSG